MLCFCALATQTVHSFTQCGSHHSSLQTTDTSVQHFTPCRTAPLFAHTHLEHAVHHERIRSRQGPSAQRETSRMMWSGGQKTRRDQVTVNIERPSLNTRRISGSIIVDKPIEDVWMVLTDYNKLADYVPNLTQSKQVEHPDGGIRLFQEGAQKIVGFDFRASLTMDMEEHYADPDDKMAMRKIKFKLIKSGMFADFTGEWRLKFNSRMVNKGALPGQERFTYTTKVFYMVYIKPKGVVPVMALEWQISEEVPKNLAAIKSTAEGATAEFMETRRQQMETRNLRSGVVMNGYSGDHTLVDAEAARAKQAKIAAAAGTVSKTAVKVAGTNGGSNSGSRGAANGSSDSGRTDWEADETLEAYIHNIKAQQQESKW